MQLVKIRQPAYNGKTMKIDIHPKYYPAAKVKCACGNQFTVGSTSEHINVETCYHCHPFYTGKDKLLDTAGKAERFHARRIKAAAATPKKVKTRVKKTPAKNNALNQESGNKKVA